jgi:hypothetical protein
MQNSTESITIAALSPRRSHLNATTAECLIAAWEKSGVSATEFCRDRSLTTETLLRWKSRLRPSTGLSRVVVVPSSDTAVAPASMLRVVSERGLSIEVPCGCDEAVLRRVCRALSC